MQGNRIRDILRGEERAVSPVIGVILMVAITVILAAVIGTFVLDIGNQVGNEQPTASFKFEFGGSGSSQYVNITHDGGDSIDRDELQVQVGTTTAWDGGAASRYQGNFDSGSGQEWATEVTAGGRLDIQETADEFGDGDEVRVIWDDPNSDKTVTIAQTEADF